MRTTFRGVVALAAGLLLAAAMSVAMPSVASAEPCVVDPAYEAGVTLGVSGGGTVTPGQTIEITGSGFPPGCEVTITIDGGIVGTVTTSASGTFSFGATLGANISGSVTIGATAGSFTKTITVPVAGAGAAALTCTPTTLTFGQAVTCNGTGFPAGGPVDFTINPPLGTAVADAGGAVTLNATIPAQSTFANGGCGAQTITGTSGSVSASAAVTITCTTGSLPVTGSDNLQLVGFGLALLAAGGLLVVATRRRSAANA